MRCRYFFIVVLLCISDVVVADTTDTQRLTEVVVTATRAPALMLNLPMSIDRLDRDAIIDGQPQIQLSESLPRIPGVIAHNRQNYAQDLQISIRGFGARSTFGVRGVRVYVDDIPATMPDGQGQLSHIDLSSIERIEVLRGPFSSLYGNSSGGVIALFSEQPKLGSALDVGFGVGSYDTQRTALKLSGASPSINYLLALTQLDSDGYRDHSAVRRNNLNSKIGLNLDAQSTLKIIVNAVDLPATEDPLGLTRAQFDSDPRQAGTGAAAFDTRKSVRQQQFGLSYRRDLGTADNMQAMFYRGSRNTVQYQATPTASQISAASAGGVIDLERAYWGTDWHWTHEGDALLGRPWQFTAGVNFDTLDELRRGYLNFSGTTLGVKGALRRDESNRVFNFDQYMQWQWQLADAVDINAGVRNSRVQVDSHDHYMVTGNGDDSGGVDYRATTPVLGISWRITDDMRVYAAYGKGFETPTLNEIAYRSTSGGNTGLNFALDPARSEHSELGMKIRTPRGGINAALFHVVTHDEIAVAANASGRSVYQNVGATQRDGVEISAISRWDNGFGVALSYTLLRAKYVNDFYACPGTPCSAPQLIEAGRYLPGIPQSAVFGELTWRHTASGFDTGLELRSEARLYANDRNTDATSGYTILNWHAGFTQRAQQWQFTEFVRIDNLADKVYAGSVIVNESNGRYFEPASERTTFIGLNARTTF